MQSLPSPDFFRQGKWPCRGDADAVCASGKRDFDRHCPLGFDENDEGDCVPGNSGVQTSSACEVSRSTFADPLKYKGPCGSKVNFSQFSNIAKEQWSVRETWTILKGAEVPTAKPRQNACDTTWACFEDCVVGRYPSPSSRLREAHQSCRTSSVRPAPRTGRSRSIGSNVGLGNSRRASGHIWGTAFARHLHPIWRLAGAKEPGASRFSQLLPSQETVKSS